MRKKIFFVLLIGRIVFGSIIVRYSTNIIFSEYWIFGLFGIVFEYAMFVIGSINIYLHFEKDNKYIMHGSLISFISAIGITIFCIVFKNTNYMMYSIVLILPPAINAIYLFCIRKMKLRLINA